MLFKPLLMLRPDNDPSLIFNQKPFAVFALFADGDAAGVCTDQLSRLGKDFCQKRVDTFRALLKHFGYFREHPDFKMFTTDLFDYTLNHFSVCLEKTHFKIGKAVDFAGEVVDEAGYPA